jgi:hypothetical protein
MKIKITYLITITSLLLFLVVKRRQKEKKKTIIEREADVNYVSKNGKK